MTRITTGGGGGGGGGGGVSDFGSLTGTAPVVQSVIYAGALAAARPTANVVVWQGFPSQPTNVGTDDMWLDADSGASLITGTAAPTTEGVDGDIYIRTGASAAIYGPKASGAWPSGTSLIGPTGASGTNGTNGRGITSVARTSGTGAAGTTDTYTITYSDATTSTFNVVNGADGAGSTVTVQDEGTPLTTAATTLNFVGSGVTATGTTSTKTITIPGAASSALAPTAKTTTYTAAANDLVLADASGGAFTVTLPTPTSGVRIGIKKTDSSTNAVTVATTSGTIDGSSTRTLLVQHQAQIYVADGTNWFRVEVPGVTAIAATGTPSSSTYLDGSGAWSTPAGGSSGITVQDEGGALATTGTTVNFVGAGVTATGTGATKTVTIPGVGRPDQTLMSGAFAATLPRWGINSNALAAAVSGRLQLFGISLLAGEVVTSISFVVAGGNGSGLTHTWFSLYSSALAKLAVTADDTSATWTAQAAKTLSLTSPYTVPTSGLYYLGLTVVGTTVPTFVGSSNTTVAPAYQGVPVINGSSTTGLTDPTTAPTTAAALAGISAVHPWAWVS